MINYAKYFWPERYYTIEHERFGQLIFDVFGVEFDYIEDQYSGHKYITDEESYYDAYDIHWMHNNQFVLDDDISNFEAWFYHSEYHWPITGTLLMFLANQSIIPYGNYLIKAY